MTEAALELTRDEIVALMEKIAKERRGVTAADVLREYREGTLDEPGELIDLLSLADLLGTDDPLHSA